MTSRLLRALQTTQQWSVKLRRRLLLEHCLLGSASHQDRADMLHSRAATKSDIKASGAEVDFVCSCGQTAWCGFRDRVLCGGVGSGCYSGGVGCGAGIGFVCCSGGPSSGVGSVWSDCCGGVMASAPATSSHPVSGLGAGHNEMHADFAMQRRASLCHDWQPVPTSKLYVMAMDLEHVAADDVATTVRRRYGLPPRRQVGLRRRVSALRLARRRAQEEVLAMLPHSDVDGNSAIAAVQRLVIWATRHDTPDPRPFEWLTDRTDWVVWAWFKKRLLKYLICWGCWDCCGSLRALLSC